MKELSPDMIELRRATENGVYIVLKDTEDLGYIDLFDVEAIDDATLKSLATQAAFACQDRGL